MATPPKAPYTPFANVTTVVPCNKVELHVYAELYLNPKHSHICHIGANLPVVGSDSTPCVLTWNLLGLTGQPLKDKVEELMLIKNNTVVEVDGQWKIVTTGNITNLRTAVNVMVSKMIVVRMNESTEDLGIPIGPPKKTSGAVNDYATLIDCFATQNTYDNLKQKASPESIAILESVERIHAEKKAAEKKAKEEMQAKVAGTDPDKSTDATRKVASKRRRTNSSSPEPEQRERQDANSEERSSSKTSDEPADDGNEDLARDDVEMDDADGNGKDDGSGNGNTDGVVPNKRQQT
jgi:hypothetical protein